MWFSRKAPEVPPPEPEPFDLTKAMRINPTAAEWKRANLLFEHPHKCRCSTCRLAAELACMIRLQNESHFPGHSGSKLAS